MTLSAYGRKLRYESFFTGAVGELWDTDTNEVLGDCTAVADAKSVECDSQLVLTPRLTCEWVN